MKFLNTCKRIIKYNFFPLFLLIPLLIIGICSELPDADQLLNADEEQLTTLRKRRLLKIKTRFLQRAAPVDRMLKEDIAVLIFTDGRKEYFQSTFQSFKENITAGQIKTKIIIDDSSDSDYASWLDINYAHEVNHIEHHPERLGCGGTIRDTWLKLNKLAGKYDYVFHLEDDFIFNHPINLDDLILILKNRPDLAQACLLRQPWNQDEINAGGIWQQNPERYTEKYVDGPNGRIYFLSHKEGFSNNPSVYSRKIVSLGWPAGNDSEERFWNEKLSPKALASSYFGSKADEPAVTHIGNKRIGMGY